MSGDAAQSLAGCLAFLLSDQARVDMLQAAVKRAGGKAPLGRALGFRDGAFVGQMLRGEKPITEKTLRRLMPMVSREATAPPPEPASPDVAALLVQLIDELRAVRKLLASQARLAEVRGGGPATAPASSAPAPRA